MEKLISKQLLSKVTSGNLNESRSIISKAKEARKRGKYFSEVSIFLSHKHNEKDIIEQVIVLLEKLGVFVYVDWMDNAMPTTTDGSTAKRIKQKIKEKDKFILLATEGAIEFKWCNWELGIGDVHKYFKNIAIMPITEKEDSKFSGNEYLQIYPIITSEYYYVTGTYYVEFEGNKIRLEQWIKQK